MNRTLTIPITEVKAKWSRVLAQLESGALREIIITRRGKSVARLSVLERRKIRLGVMNGKYPIPDDIDGDNAEIAREMEGQRMFPARRASRPADC